MSLEPLAASIARGAFESPYATILPCEKLRPGVQVTSLYLFWTP
jgi:hypothetical protein